MDGLLGNERTITKEILKKRCVLSGLGLPCQTEKTRIQSQRKTLIGEWEWRDTHPATLELPSNGFKRTKEWNETHADVLGRRSRPAGGLLKTAWKMSWHFVRWRWNKARAGLFTPGVCARCVIWSDSPPLSKTYAFRLATCAAVIDLPLSGGLRGPRRDHSQPCILLYLKLPTRPHLKLCPADFQALISLGVPTKATSSRPSATAAPASAGAWTNTATRSPAPENRGIQTAVGSQHSPKHAANVARRHQTTCNLLFDLLKWHCRDLAS